VTRNDCNRCCCGRSLSDGLGSFVPRMSSRRPENAHSRRGSCAAIGSLTARAGFLPKPRLHSLQNLCASSLSSRWQVAHLIMAALHHTNLSSPWPRARHRRRRPSLPLTLVPLCVAWGAPLRMSEKGRRDASTAVRGGWGGPAFRASRWPFDGPWRLRGAPPGRATPREFVVFENSRCWRLVRDQLWMASGRTSRRRRLPRL
jgi:hypothetical protein